MLPFAPRFQSPTPFWGSMRLLHITYVPYVPYVPYTQIPCIHLHSLHIQMYITYICSIYITFTYVPYCKQKGKRILTVFLLSSSLSEQTRIVVVNRLSNRLPKEIPHYSARHWFGRKSAPIYMERFRISQSVVGNRVSNVAPPIPLGVDLVKNLRPIQIKRVQDLSISSCLLPLKSSIKRNSLAVPLGSDLGNQ